MRAAKLAQLAQNIGSYWANLPFVHFLVVIGLFPWHFCVVPLPNRQVSNSYLILGSTTLKPH